MAFSLRALRPSRSAIAQRHTGPVERFHTGRFKGCADAICNLFADTGAKAVHVVALDYPAAIEARSTGMITFGGTIKRTLTLSSETLAGLDLYLASCEFPFDSHSPLFLNHKGERLSATIASDCVNELSERLGSGHKMTPSFGHQTKPHYRDVLEGIPARDYHRGAPRHRDRGHHFGNPVRCRMLRSVPQRPIR